MSTRRQTTDGPLRQERFASSQEFSTGLKANLVAKRCALLESEEERELIWFIQLRSHQEGGLKALAAEITDRYAKQFHREFRNEDGSIVYGDLEDYLARVCLDPEQSVSGPWYFDKLIERLADLKAEWIAAHEPARTTILDKVYDALDYARESRRLVVQVGEARTGKTYAAKSWCAQHPGSARYVEVPTGNDEVIFFQAIARAIGLGNFQQYKAREIRQRVESVLLTRQLLVAFDESHLLWPSIWQRFAFPKRIQWLMSMSNQGVPIFLIGQPEFWDRLNVAERVSGWNSAQFIGRIGHHERLPGSVTPADLRALASAFLPASAPRTDRIARRIRAQFVSLYRRHGNSHRTGQIPCAQRRPRKD